MYKGKVYIDFRVYENLFVSENDIKIKSIQCYINFCAAIVTILELKLLILH